MRAAEYFQNGYSCSESMIKWAIDEGLVSADLLPVATSFSGGMGVGCLCGAVAGAQMIIGSLYGRENKNGNEITLCFHKASDVVWTVTEKSTGFRVCQGSKRMEALEEAKKYLDLIYEKMQQAEKYKGIIARAYAEG